MKRDDLAPDPVLVEPVQRQIRQARVLRVADPVLTTGPAPVTHFQIRQLPAEGVRRERGQPVAVDIVEPQLSARMGPFAPHDHPHTRRPAGQVNQPGELGHIRAVTGLAIGVVGRGPHMVWNQVIEIGGVHRQREPDRIRHPPSGEGFQGGFGGPGPVDPDQHPTSRAWPQTDLVQGVGDHLLVVGGGVRACVAGPQQDGQRFAGPGRAVVGKRAQRMEPIALLERRTSLLLLGVRGDQRRVQIDDQRIRHRGPPAR